MQDRLTDKVIVELLLLDDLQFCIDYLQDSNPIPHVKYLGRGLIVQPVYVAHQRCMFNDEHLRQLPDSEEVVIARGRKVGFVDLGDAEGDSGFKVVAYPSGPHVHDTPNNN